MDAIISIVNELYENIWVLLGAFTGCAIAVSYTHLRAHETR